jgi:hypothetical protein
LIRSYEGKDIKKAFEGVGHSEGAWRILRGYMKKTEEEEEEVVEKVFGSNPEVRIGFWEFLKKKLITPEDKNHIHKILGLSALVSFFYRYLVVWPNTGELGFREPSPFNIISMTTHWLLSFSSIIFHVLASRNVREPLIIYEEYRLHAMLFTTRACLVTLIGWLSLHQPSILWLGVLYIHLLADRATDIHGTKGVTAVRNDGRGKTWFLKPMRLFYSYYQFLALGSHLIDSPYLADLGFNTLAAIQTSAFLMTLRRKSIIRWEYHMLWYSLALFLSTGFIWQVHGPWFFLKAALCFLVRCTFPNLPKYYIWTGFILSNGII